MPEHFGPELSLPDVQSSLMAIGPPGEGRGNWAGAPSALKVDGTYYLAYRMRSSKGERGYGVAVAASSDGIEFETLVVLEKEDFVAASLERPALTVRPDGGWRLYVSCATPGSDHWWVDALDANDPAGFNAGSRVTVLAGDNLTALKDPVVLCHREEWLLWVCRHPLSDPNGTDRMDTVFGTSENGLDWHLEGAALEPIGGTWFERGARVSCVVEDGDKWIAYFDGRASSAENAEERCGLAFGDTPRLLRPAGQSPAAVSPFGSGSLRYLSIVDLGDGCSRLYYEACLSDGSHGLFTQLCEPRAPKDH
jgi:hypothetical protein